MTDMLLEFAKNPAARKMVGGMKLPIPLPEDLKRPRGPMVERFLEGQRVLVGGNRSNGALTQALGHWLANSSRRPLVHWLRMPFGPHVLGSISVNFHSRRNL